MTRTLAIGLFASLFVTQLTSCKKESITTPASTAGDATEVVAKPNLVAWYKFTNGITADYSGRNNHLTPFNITKTADRLGQPNNAVNLNGFSSYMLAANSASLNPSTISIAALVKPAGYYTGEGESTRILMKGIDDQSNGTYFLGYYTNGSIYGTYGDNQFNSNGVSSPTGFLKLDEWISIVYTYDGKIGKLYVNGSLVGKTSKVATFSENGDYLRIGTTGRFDYPYWFNGAIDEIRIYNKALTAVQAALVSNELGK